MSVADARLNFAVLGCDPPALSLIQSIVQGGQHAIIAWCAESLDSGNLASTLSHARRLSDWRALLNESDVDAVIVARGAPVEALRSLAQTPVPMLLVHPVCEATVGVELDMIRRDTDCPMMAYIPGRLHPIWERLQAVLRGSESETLGSIEQLLIRRSLADRSRDNVLGLLACDAELVRMLLGDVQQVNASGAERDRKSLANLIVTLKGPHPVTARWSVEPTAGEPSCEVELIGSRGRFSITIPDAGPWICRQTPAQGAELKLPPHDDAAATVALFAEVCRGAEAPFPSWPDACRAIDVAATSEDSIRRGRTVTLYDQEHSEEQTFKGLMAIGGCAILLVVLLVLFGLAIFDGFSIESRDVRDRIGQEPAEPTTPLYLRIWPVYPLVGFLLLQLLRFVFRDEHKQASDG